MWTVKNAGTSGTMGKWGSRTALAAVSLGPSVFLGPPTADSDRMEEDEDPQVTQPLGISFPRYTGGERKAEYR